MKIAPPMWGGLGEGPVKVIKKPLVAKEEVDVQFADSLTEVFSDDEGMDDVPPGERFPLGTFILSVLGRTKRRTLHIMGGCYRISGVYYREYVVVGMERPEISAESGERLCSICFTPKEKIAEALTNGEEAEQSTSSESSSSEGVSDEDI